MSDKALSKLQKSQQLSNRETSDSDVIVEKTPFAIGFPFFCLVLVLLIYSGVLAYQWLQDEQRLPVQEIVVSGNLTMLDEQLLTKIVRNKAKGSFFALDVNHVHALMEQQPWVYSASVRKRWPSKLYIHIVEQKAVASWNDDLLLNRFGDTFDGLIINDKGLNQQQSLVLQKLPQLFGPMGSEKTALTGYTHMQRLLNISGQKIALLSLSERFAWQAKLSNQTMLKLGRQEYINRLQRYIDVLPLLEKQEKLVAYVDLRYDTGLAVGWGDVRGSEGADLKANNKNNS
jgi:cell division protein FtsQ